MDGHPSGPRKGPVDRTPPTGRLTVTHTEGRGGLCSRFRLQGSWQVSSGQLPTPVALLLSGYLARQETDQNFNSTWVK